MVQVIQQLGRQDLINRAIGQRPQDLFVGTMIPH
jgi:hypothetical protein